MKALALAASLAMLSAVSAVAQTPAPRPAAPAAQAPPAQAPAPVAPPPSAPFPDGAKIGVVNTDQIVQSSVEGKAVITRLNAAAEAKQKEGTDKAKALQANQQKMDQSGALMSEAARAQLQKDIERQTLEVQRFQQDAQAELNELQQELLGEFEKKVVPVLQQLAKEKGLHMLVNRLAVNPIYLEPGIDLTAEAIKRMDAVAKPAGAGR